MPRIVLTFKLSGTSQQQDLLHEFEMHDEVVAHAPVGEGPMILKIETNDSPAALWDVRATVGIFDEYAFELLDEADELPA